MFPNLPDPSLTAPPPQPVVHLDSLWQVVKGQDFLSMLSNPSEPMANAEVDIRDGSVMPWLPPDQVALMMSHVPPATKIDPQKPESVVLPSPVQATDQALDQDAATFAWFPTNVMSPWAIQMPDQPELGQSNLPKAAQELAAYTDGIALSVVPLEDQARDPEVRLAYVETEALAEGVSLEDPPPLPLLPLLATPQRQVSDFVTPLQQDALFHSRQTAHRPTQIERSDGETPVMPVGTVQPSGDVRGQASAGTIFEFPDDHVQTVTTREVPQIGVVDRAPANPISFGEDMPQTGMGLALISARLGHQVPPSEVDANWLHGATAKDSPKAGMPLGRAITAPYSAEISVAAHGHRQILPAKTTFLKVIVDPDQTGQAPELRVIPQTDHPPMRPPADAVGLVAIKDGALSVASVFPDINIRGLTFHAQTTAEHGTIDSWETVQTDAGNDRNGVALQLRDKPDLPSLPAMDANTRPIEGLDASLDRTTRSLWPASDFILPLAAPHFELLQHMHVPQVNSVPSSTYPSLPVATQMIAAVLAAPSTETPGKIEITLTPETLGRVHFDMQPDTKGLTITISAERPETLDLIRRNLPDLMAEFQQAGIGAGTFQFGGWHDRAKPQDKGANRKAGLFDALALAAPSPSHPPQPSAAGQHSLHIRL